MRTYTLVWTVLSLSLNFDLYIFMKMRDRSLHVKDDNIKPNKVIIEKSFYVKQMSKNQSQLVIDHKNDGFLFVYIFLD